MESLFVIPMLVSPNVNEKLVPAVSKLLERSIALQNFALFRAAILRKYLKSDVYAESKVPSINYISNFLLKEGRYTPTYKNTPTALGTATKVGGELYNKGENLVTGKKDDNKNTIGPAEFTKLDNKSMKLEGEIEMPRGITFFNQISPEPTILELPIKVPIHKFLRSHGVSDRLVRIGFKCLPYSVKKVDDIVWLMQDATRMNIVKRMFLKNSTNLISKIPFTDESKIRAGIPSSEIYKNIIMAPPYSSLSSSRKLAKIMSGGGLTTKLTHMMFGGYTSWSTIVCLSSFDLSDEELKNIMFNYSKLVKYVFGDIAVVNETKENLYLCSARSQSCSEISFSYLRNILNLANVLDYSEVSSFSKPFKKVSFNKVVEESYSPLYNNLLDIIRDK